MAEAIAWTASAAAAVLFLVAGVHHLRTRVPLAIGSLRSHSATRLVGAAEVFLAVALVAAALTSSGARVAVGSLVAAVGIAFVLISSAALRTGKDCGCLPLGRDESQSSMIPALVVLVAGAAIVASSGVDLTLNGPSAVALAQGLAVGLTTWLFAAASATVTLPKAGLDYSTNPIGVRP